MKMIVADVKDGRSCVVDRLEWEHDLSAPDVSGVAVQDIDPGDPAARPIGRTEYRDFGIAPGTAKWLRVRWPADQLRPLHYTNTIDTITVIEGSLSLILDDGEHELKAGDCTVIRGVDHGWRVGPDGCTTSNILFGISAE